MNKAVKKLWVKELRSGDFKQGKGRLRDADNRCCCLGVLCELAYEAGVIPAPKLASSLGYVYAEENYGGLPKVVRVWSGLDSDEQEAYLANLNDSFEESFKQIADYIEANL